MSPPPTKQSRGSKEPIISCSDSSYRWGKDGENTFPYLELKASPRNFHLLVRAWTLQDAITGKTMLSLCEIQVTPLSGAAGSLARWSSSARSGSHHRQEQRCEIRVTPLSGAAGSLAQCSSDLCNLRLPFCCSQYFSTLFMLVPQQSWFLSRPSWLFTGSLGGPTISPGTAPSPCPPGPFVTTRSDSDVSAFSANFYFSVSDPWLLAIFSLNSEF